MIRILSIDRKVEVDNGGVASNASCKVVLTAGSENATNKARFLLTAEEAAAVDELTKRIEARIAQLLASDYEAPAANGETAAIATAGS